MHRGQPKILPLVCLGIMSLLALSPAFSDDDPWPTMDESPPSSSGNHNVDTSETLTQMLGLQPEYIHNALPHEKETHFFEHGYGDIRAALKKSGLTIDLRSESEFMANIAGGIRQKQDFDHQAILTAGLDLDKIAQIPDASLVFAAVQRSGRRLSGDALADDVYNPALIYGGGGNVLVHVIYFYYQQTWLRDRIRLIIGRYGPGPDFDAAEMLCEFPGGSVCAQPRAATVNLNGYSSWPGSSWGANLKAHVFKDLYLMPGIFTSEVQHGGTAGTNWNSAVGVTLFGEAGWEPDFGANHLTGHYKMGYMWDSSRHHYNWPSRETGLPGTRRGQMMSWIAFDQMIWRHGHYATAGLMLLGGFTHITSSISTIANQWYAGFLDFGLIPARPHDGIGLVISKLYYGKKVKAVYQPTRRTTDLNGPELTALASPPLLAKHTSVIELMYRLNVTNGVFFIPEFQYIWRPGGTGKVRNAPVIGFDMRVLL